MKRYLWGAVLLIIALFLVPPSQVLADIGPKPSVTITFEESNVGQYYVTLLSKEERVGPWSKNGEFGTGYGKREIWEKFNQYVDNDGFYFIGNYGECEEDTTYTWGYYPPSTFKILLYFPEKDTFVVSQNTYERYAFDSYFTVQLNDMEISNGSIEKEKVTASYPISSEIAAMLCRMAATILIEVLIAWFFGYRKKQQIGILIVTNLITQGVLNILLNVTTYKHEPSGTGIQYFLLECLVIVLEGFLYQKLLLRYEEKSEEKGTVWLYAVTANVVSFVIGIGMAKIVPSMF